VLTYLLTLALSLTAAPIIALLLTIGVPGYAGDPIRTNALRLLALTALLTAGYVCVALFVCRSRESLSRYFPAVVRSTLIALVLVLLAQGLLLFWAVYIYGMSGDRSAQPLYVLGVLGAGLLFAAFLIVMAWRDFVTVEPLIVSGKLVDLEEIPELAERIRGIAQRVGAAPPVRLILGLEPRAFVVASEVNLRGVGYLPPAETLYLPLIALRALGNAELDAVIGHELGHFRGKDLQFSRRFLPVYRSVLLSLDQVNVEDESEYPYLRLARLPAISALAGMFHILHNAVSRITRERELEADKAGAAVSSGTAIVSSLVKLALMNECWPLFQRATIALVHSGIARKNLVEDYLAAMRIAVTGVNAEELRGWFLAAQLAHPMDSHPTLATRASALKVDAAAVIDQAVSELKDSVSSSSELSAYEEAVSAFEIEELRLPGSRLTIDRRPAAELGF
jgi:Zn-dependent protease with chaperone function